MMIKGPLRVCFVIQKLLDLTGGAERILLQTARTMAARGVDVEILIYDTPTGTPQFDTGNVAIRNLLPGFLKSGKNRSAQTPTSLKRLPHGRLLGYLKYTLTHGLFTHRLKTALRQRAPDVIVAFLPPAINAAVNAANPLGIPVIASTHNVPEEDFGLTSPRWDQNPIYRRSARSALSQASAITILQDSFRDWFSPAEQARLTLMPNPISRLSPLRSPAPVREKRVIGVGRLVPVKRFDLLISAWAKIHPQFKDWCLDIYGEGTEHSALSAQIKEAGLQDHIRLCGVNADLGSVYDRASLLCHPAAFEGFGLAVAEAMAHGTPAMAFEDCPGINALITHDTDGLLLGPTKDRVAALANGLTQALSQPAHLRQLGRAGRRILQTYDPAKIASQWDALIRKTAAEHIV